MTAWPPHRALIALLPIVMTLATVSGGAEQPRSARELTEQHCARCHAMGLSDASAHPAAPPFRDMFKLYPVYALGDALRRGIEVGHSDMPKFTLRSDEAVAIVDYLESLNPCARASSDDAAMQRCFEPL